MKAKSKDRKQKPNLVWFRNDLRTQDNSALGGAAEQDPVIGYYQITPKQWQRHAMAACRVDFLLRTLKVLRADLKRLGIPLIVEQVAEFADTPAALLAITRRHRCQGVYWSDEYPLNELRRDQACVDAGMCQLLQTGWMHNRVRMIVAMFLSKNLLLDWRLGERFFMQHLIDGDFASNNGGWQWSACRSGENIARSNPVGGRSARGLSVIDGGSEEIPTASY
jgi:deoxyribodipyrimidine photolyase